MSPSVDDDGIGGTSAGEFWAESRVRPVSGGVEAFDDSLVTQAQSGDNAAMGALWERHRTWLAAVLATHLRSADEVDDVLQEVAMVMVSRLREIRSAGNVRSWLRTVAVNRAVDRHRRRATVPVDPDVCAAPEASDDNSVGVERCLQKLPVDLREVLVLRAVEGLSQRQIAATLEVPVTTVETRLVRARKKLREIMERLELRECS